MDDILSIAPSTTPDEPLSLVSDSPVVTPQTASSRAAKASFGLSDKLDKTYEDYYGYIVGGQENNLRREASASLDAKRYQNVSGVASQNVSPAEQQFLRGEALRAAKFNDPNTVFEDNYAKQYFNYLYSTPTNTTPSGWFADALREIPLHTKTTIDAGSDFLANTEYWRTKYENAKDATDNQGYFSWGLDKAKQFFQIYNEFQLRQGDSFWTGIGLGSNMEETARNLNSLPPEIMKVKADEIIQKLNPSMGMIFAQAMIGQSSSDIAVNNLMSTLVAGDIGLAKGLFGLTKGAVTGMLRSSRNVVFQPIKTVAADAAGDLADASVTKAATEQAEALRGALQPSKAAIEPLFNGLRTDEAAYTANPGRFGQEIVNRLTEDNNIVVQQVKEAIELMPQVQRLPELLKNEELYRAAQQQLRDRFPGPANMILDISPLRYNRAVRGWEADLHLGSPSGEAFDSEHNAAVTLAANGIPVTRITRTIKEILEEGLAGKARKTQVEMGQLGRISSDQVITKKVKIGDKEYTSYRPAGTKSTDVEAAKSALARIEATLADPAERARQAKAGTGMFEHLEKQAEALRNKINSSVTPTYENIIQQGKGWIGVVTKPLDVTGEGIRNNLLGETTTYLNPWWGGKLSKWFTPNESLSPAETANRTAAVYGPSSVKKILSENAAVFNEARSAIKNLGRNKNFQNVLNYSQNTYNPATGKTGVFFDNIAALEEHYYRNEGFFPTEKEIRGYFAWKRGIEVERVFANMNELAKMHNMGSETHALSYQDAKGKQVNKEFVGIGHKTPPPNNRDAVLVLTDGPEGHSIKPANFFHTNSKLGQEITEGLKNGTWKNIQPWNPDQNPLKGFSVVNEEPIRWVVSKNVATKPLTYDQIPRTEGGHLIYEYKRWIKQPIIKTYKVGNKEYTEYAGDKTLFALEDNTSGKGWLKNLKDFQTAYKSGDFSLANKIADELPVKYKDLEQAIKKGLFNLEADVRIVPRNTRIIEMDNSIYDKYGTNIKDGSKHGSSPARSLVNPYTYEKDVHDLHVLGEEGSTANPTFTYRPARPLDAAEAMNRGLSRIINSAFMDDYKLSSLEHWFQEAKPLMDAKKFNELMEHPAYHFYKDEDDNLPWLKEPGMQNKIEQLKSARIQIKAFNGIPSGLDAQLDKTEALLEESIHGSHTLVGQTMARAGLAGLMSARWAGPALRKATYNSVMGLFTPTQFLVQNMTYVNIFAIAPKYASQGTFAALVHQWSRFNPVMLPNLFKMSESMGWKPGQLERAMKLGQQTGFFTVGGEHSFTGYEYATPKIYQNAGGRFLDAGQYSFKGGERNVRFGAWYTAVNEWEAVNPGRTIREADLNNIISRADLLAGNMTKASKSGLQNGLAAYPTQFMGYQMRTAELIMGKRLTTAERIRLGSINAAMYGIPASIGITALPFGDSIREYATKNGYVEGKNPVFDFVMEGAPSMFLHYITDNWYNVGPRLGYGGVGAIHDALLSDKPWWQWIGGASFSTLSSAVESFHPFWKYVVHAIQGDQEKWPIKADDLLQPIKNISSGNIALREQYALNTGHWMSKNNTYIGDVSPLESMLLSLSGLQPQAQTQANTMYNLVNKQTETQKTGTNNAIKEINKFFIALKDKNDSQADDYMKRAFSELIDAGVPQEEWGQVIRTASNNYGKTLIERLDWQWYMTKVPPSNFDDRLSAFRTKLQLQGK